MIRGRQQEAKEGRDRAFLLARLVREADRRFRDENQPELLLRAGRYLKHVTRGRYDRIEMGETGDESFYLREPSGSRMIQVGQTTSQGTKEQVYLALRLAIVNHLDTGHERLPIFMDETLVNWDAWRRDRAFDLLHELASERQLLCNLPPRDGGEMEDRGGRIIRSAPRDPRQAAPPPTPPLGRASPRRPPCFPSASSSSRPSAPSAGCTASPCRSRASFFPPPRSCATAPRASPPPALARPSP